MSSIPLVMVILTITGFASSTEYFLDKPLLPESVNADPFMIADKRANIPGQSKSTLQFPDEQIPSPVPDQVAGINDTEARGIVRDKLCSLGLAQVNY